MEYPRVWLLIFGILYLCFLVLGLFWPNSIVVAVLKVGSIFLCFLFSVIYSRKDKTLIVAMAATFAADVILAINNVAVSGVVVFSLAQTAHFVRLSQKLVRNLVSYAVIILIMIGVAIIRQADLMHVVGGVYALLLLSNLFMSFRWFKSSKKLPAGCAFFGFLLFVLCDSCVATSYLSLTEILPGFLYAIANYFAWVFYLPAQILISNSPKHVLQ
ncbi:hypothetical protein IJI94_02930 [Candidatus Saccharibacteria bacterium]|nr:hypothetical protein [Candidatus Saccharibacteria bacterium]